MGRSLRIGIGKNPLNLDRFKLFYEELPTRKPVK